MVLSFLQPPLRRLAGGLRGAGGGSRLLLLLQPGARRSEAFTHALFVRCELLHPLDRALELPPETQARGFTLHKPDPLSSCGAGKVVPASGYRSKGAYAAICTNVKDEGLNLVEFILYHEWVGFGKIYVMDYNSSRPLSNMRMLLPFIRSGLVEYHYDADPRHHSPRRGGVFADYSQGTAFQRCIDFAHRDHMWMAFIDADEYLIVRDSSPPRNSSAASPPPPPPPPPQAAVARPNISALLRHYEQYPGVGVNMRYFGSSGHVQRPTAGTLEAYTACSPAAAWDNRHIKTIARMSAVLAIGGNPHEFVYIGGGVAVNELGLPVQGPESLPVSWSRLALHHYVTRSLSEFLAKMRRGPGGSQNRRTLDWFRAYDGNATETCGEGPALWQACCAERYEALRAEWLAAAARGRARRRGGDGGA